MRLSPYTRVGRVDLAAAVTDRVLQFWTVEHGPTMLVAVALVHNGRVRIDCVATRPSRASAGRHLARCRHRARPDFDPCPFLPYGRGLLPALAATAPAVGGRL